MGWNSQHTSTVNFDNCEIPIDNIVGNEGDGFKIAMKGLDGGRINIAACSLGGARAALEASIMYSAERKQFGKSIDQFQVTQFKLADMATELEASRLMVFRAASSLDNKDPQTTKLCAMAKRFTTDICSEICNTALQIHGGYGYYYNGHTHFFNASVLNERYSYANLPFHFEWDSITNQITWL